MTRREFITLLGGATVAWPLTARAPGRDDQSASISPRFDLDAATVRR